jgi:hypothetical protein
VSPRSLLVLAGLGVVACTSAEEEARRFKRCAGAGDCHRPNLCLRDGDEGRCVKPCTRDAACPAPLRCVGRLRVGAETRRYCRRVTAKEGQSCRAVADGCLPGLECYQGRCARRCAGDPDCTGATRCLPVRSDSVFSADASVVYRACVPATARAGELCQRTGPFCGPGLVCHGFRCLKTCAADPDCGPGAVCDGQARPELLPIPSSMSAPSSSPAPVIAFCRQAGPVGAPCGTAEASCARPLRCEAGRCTP